MESSFLLCFIRRLLADFVKSRSKGYATCTGSACREGYILNACASCKIHVPVARCSKFIGAGRSPRAFVQCGAVRSGPTESAARYRRGSLRADRTDTIVEVRCFTAVRSGVTDERPTTSLAGFSEICLLQLHVGSCINVECLRR